MQNTSCTCLGNGGTGRVTLPGLQGGIPNITYWLIYAVFPIGIILFHTSKSTRSETQVKVSSIKALPTQLLIIPIHPIFGNRGQKLTTNLFSHTYKYDSPKNGYVQGHQTHCMCTGLSMFGFSDESVLSSDKIK